MRLRCHCEILFKTPRSTAVYSEQTGTKAISRGCSFLTVAHHMGHGWQPSAAQAIQETLHNNQTKQSAQHTEQRYRTTRVLQSLFTTTSLNLTDTSSPMSVSKSHHTGWHPLTGYRTGLILFGLGIFDSFINR